MTKKAKEVKHSDIETDIFEILEDEGGVHSVVDIADRLNRTPGQVRRAVRRLRRRFNELDEKITQWIFTTKGGYTMDEKPEHALYESRLRLSMGTGVILNGMYAIKTSKRLALSEFNKMMVVYRPKMLMLGKAAAIK